MSDVTQADYLAAADLACRAEAVAFSGNDVAALRLGVAGDDEILGFVELVASVRLQARADALEAAEWAAHSAIFDVCMAKGANNPAVDYSHAATAAIRALATSNKGQDA